MDAYEHRLTTKWPEKPRREWKQGQRKLWRNLDIVHGNFSNYELLCEKKNWRQDNYDKIALFVTELLNHCHEYRPEWLTVHNFLWSTVEVEIKSTKCWQGQREPGRQKPDLRAA